MTFDIELKNIDITDPGIRYKSSETHAFDSFHLFMGNSEMIEPSVIETGQSATAFVGEQRRGAVLVRKSLGDYDNILVEPESGRQDPLVFFRRFEHKYPPGVGAC